MRKCTNCMAVWIDCVLELGFDYVTMCAVCVDRLMMRDVPCITGISAVTQHDISAVTGECSTLT